jgi:hypothetical protein
MPITRIGDKIIVTGKICPPGMAYVINQSFVDNLYGFNAKDIDWRPPVPYDRAKVPEGHEPKLMISEHIDLDWSFRVKTNNWFIDTFGTRPIPFRFKSSYPFSLSLKNPSYVMGVITS